MADAANTNSAVAQSVVRMKCPGVGGPRNHVPLRGELETWGDREKLTEGVNQKLQVARRPGRGPGTGPVKNWPPHRKVNLQAGWHIGNWKSDGRLCLYHPETRTALFLVTGEDVGHFGLPWTAEDEPMFVDIDNVDFCVEPTTITCKDSLDNAELEAAIGDKLRLVLPGNSPPARSQQLQFKPATMYMDISTGQQVAIVGSSEHSNLKKMKHVLVAVVTEDRAANIDNITKAKKEHLVRMSGRHRYCNVDKLLADIRRVYFPSFATSPQEIMEALGGYAATVATQASRAAGIVSIEVAALPPYQDAPWYIPFASPSAFNNTTRQHGLHRETVRMQTFESWPLSSPVAPIGLVQAGFFYIGKELYVECFVCGRVKGDWKYGDDLLQCHENMDGWCQFVLGYDVGNIPLKDDNNALAMSRHEIGMFGTLSMQAGPDTSNALELLNEIRQEYERVKEKISCKICMDADIAYAFLPCGHLVVCSKCVKNAHKICPMCRQTINDTKKIYF